MADENQCRLRDAKKSAATPNCAMKEMEKLQKQNHTLIWFSMHVRSSGFHL